MTFRFVHTADLHLDAPLTTMALRDPDLAQEIGVASRTAFSRIVDLCISEGAAFLLIAGDLWDGTYSSTKTPRYLKQELLRLREAGIRCFIIRGNHDALARQTGELEAPDNTTIFGARASTFDFEIDGRPVAIHGLSFREAQAPDSLLPRYPAARGGAFNIGMMHTSLNGSLGHDPYAPCSLADLDGHGYHYWALGHVHRRAQHQGRSTIVMPGIPQGRDIGEAGPASVTVVDVADDDTVTLSQRSVAAIRFERLEIDCSGQTDWSDLVALIETRLGRAAGLPRPEQHLVLRPVLTGATPLSWRIDRDRDRLTEEARSFAGSAGLWIDKLELRVTQSDDRPAGALPDGLAAMMLRDLPDDPALQAAILTGARDLLRDLPPEARDILGHDEDALPARCRALLVEGLPPTLTRLSDGGAS